MDEKTVRQLVQCNLARKWVDTCFYFTTFIWHGEEKDYLPLAVTPSPMFVMASLALSTPAFGMVPSWKPRACDCIPLWIENLQEGTRYAHHFLWNLKYESLRGSTVNTLWVSCCQGHGEVQSLGHSLPTPLLPQAVECINLSGGSLGKKLWNYFSIAQGGQCRVLYAFLLGDKKNKIEKMLQYKPLKRLVWPFWSINKCPLTHTH